MKIYAVIAASGVGSRFDRTIPKQFSFINGIIPVRESVHLFLSLPYISGVVCVIPKGHDDSYAEALNGVADSRLFPPVYGGESRKDSVRIGLDSLVNLDPDFVLIHDAARCYCSTDIVDRVVSALRSGSKAAIPTVPLVDSARIDSVAFDRNRIELVQTPQGFDFKTIHNLHHKYISESATDDASLCDIEGIEVKSVMGSPNNKKLTYKSDVSEKVFKTGFGFDAHRFSTDSSRKLFIMGVDIPDHIGLEGVSDADVGIHSLVDAIFGALGVGSIGEHFPPSDPKNKNIDSKVFLTYCRELLRERRAKISNIDTTIVCERPNISKHSSKMKSVIAECLEIDEDKINIKGKTTEGMGFEGRKEGISAYSIVTIEMF